MQNTNVASLQQLLVHLQNAEQLAGSLCLSDLAANQKFWQLRVLQLQRQQQQQDIQQLLLKHGAPGSTHQSSPHATAPPLRSPSASPTPTATFQHCSRGGADHVTVPDCRCTSGCNSSNSSSPVSDKVQQPSFTLQFPLTLSRPLGPFDTSAQGAQVQAQHLQHAQQQQQQSELEPRHNPQQHMQQQQSAQHPQLQLQAGGEDQSHAGQVGCHRPPPSLLAQQQPVSTAGPSSSGHHSSAQTSLLDALAVAAAAVAAGDTLASMDKPGPLTTHQQQHLHQEQQQYDLPYSRSRTTEWQLLVSSDPAAAAAAADGASSSQQADAAAADCAGSPCGSNGPFDDTSSAAAAVAAAAAAGGEAVKSGSVSARKSDLLELADQLGAQAVAEAVAAAERGEPLSYQAVMALLAPLEEGVREVLGAQLQEAPDSGVQLGDVRRMFFYNQAHTARHFGMGTTKFKPLLRCLGVKYWPQRQFMALVEALNYLVEKTAECRDVADVPGRMLVLHHAWFLLNSHPNMHLDSHAASAVKKALHKQSFKERVKLQQQLQRQHKQQKQQQQTPSQQQQQQQQEEEEEEEEEDPAHPSNAGADAGGVSPPLVLSRRTAKRKHAELEHKLQAGVAAALAAEAGGGKTGSNSSSSLPSAVTAQVLRAVQVWPEPLRYLASQAAEVLLLPPPP